VQNLKIDIQKIYYQGEMLIQFPAYLLNNIEFQIPYNYTLNLDFHLTSNIRGRAQTCSYSSGDAG